MNLEDETLENSDTEDEDFVPGGEQNDLSEEEDDGDDEETGTQQRKGRKKSITGKRPKAKRRRKRRNDDSDQDSDDDEADADFVVDGKSVNEEEELEDVPDPEVVAAKEKKEKERTDVLWADFLTSVETMKSKKADPSRSKDKTVTKVYDFAGERVEVQERVRGTPEDSETRSSTPSSMSSFAGESSNSLESSARRLNGSSSGSLFLNGIEPVPNKPPPPKRIRISFLSGDPADIGLGGDKKSTSAKEGLANVLNAMHARNKKLGTLDKSKLDWEAYKREEGLQEELESHNRSKHGYIDKQEFLQRADLRQFEQEKNARAKRRRNNL